MLRFRLRLAKFLYSIHYTPGKQLCLADALSRAPLPNVQDSIQIEEVKIFVQSVVSSLPAHDDRLNEFRQVQAKDPVCSQLM